MTNEPNQTQPQIAVDITANAMREAEIPKVDCKMCRMGAIGTIWTRDIAIGTRTVDQAVKMFKMTPEAVMEHMSKHEIKKSENGKLYSDDFLLNELLYMLNGLKDWMDIFLATDEVNAASVSAITKLSKEIRETLSKVAELQGRLESKTMNINIEKMQNKVLILTNIVIQDACDSCRKKIMDAIESTDFEMIPDGQEAKDVTCVKKQ